MQPFWHTGLRANLAVNDYFALNLMVVNGVNSPFEGNKSPSVGVQLMFTPFDDLYFSLGYMTAFNPRSGDDEKMATKNFQDFLDAVVTYNHGGFKAVFNADYNSYNTLHAERVANPGLKKRNDWWGVSFAPGYSFTNWFGVAGRVEYLTDSANSQLAMPSVAYGGKAVHLTTLTGTLDFKPVENLAAVILRPEFRYEIASNDYYFTQHSATANSKHFWSAQLGVVVTSMP
jgi:hypothetical protein